MKKVLISAFVLLFFNLSFAATYYVSNTGSDSNSGTSESAPWKTIAKVNAKAFLPGDQILFKRDGTWYETLTVKYDNILFGAYGSGNLPIIDGQLTRTNNIVFSGRTGVTIREIEVKNSAGSGSIRVSDSRDILIENCVVYATAKGIYFQTSSNCTARGNKITTPSYINTQTDGIYSQRNNGMVYENNHIVISNTAESQHNDGIQCYLDTDITARNNYIEQDNYKTGNAQGIYSTNTYGRHVWYNNVINTPNTKANSLGFKNLESQYTGTVEAYHNTVITYGGNAFCVVNAPGFIAKNNIFISNYTTYAIYIDGAISNFSNLNHNIYFNKGTSKASAYLTNYGGTNTIDQLKGRGAESYGMFGNPMLASDYTPADGSPVIDKGVNLPSPYNYDKDGCQRPVGTYADLGALEKGGGVTITVPDAPSELIAAALSQTQVKLDWTDNSSNESGFKVERRKDSETTWSQVASVSTDVKTFSNDGLSAGTKYFYRVRSYNSAGNSGYSNEVSITTESIVVTVPAPPADLTAAALSPTQVKLDWKDNSSDESGFKIERRKDSETAWSQVASVGADIKTFSNDGLSAGTKYFYRVRSYNSAGNSGYSNEASITTESIVTIPAPPANLTAEALSQTQVKLDWTDNSSDESGFKVERRKDTETAWNQVVSLSANVKTFSDEELSAGTKYFYRICSHNSAGSSGYSNEVSVTTKNPELAAVDQTISTASGNFSYGATEVQQSGSYSSTVLSLPTNKSVAEYTITINTPGTYFLMSRVFYPIKGNSFNISMNGSNFSFGNTKITGTWFWTPKISLGSLEPGTYTFQVSNARSNGAVIDVFVLTTDAKHQGADVNVTVSENVLSNYPNPFNPQTRVRFTLSKAEPVNLSVYDILGNRVAELVNETYNAGTHEVTFDGANLASGIYILHLQTSDYVKTVKMNLLK